MVQWGNAKTNSFGDKFAFTDHAQFLDLSQAAADKWYRIRCIGELWPVRQLWFETKSDQGGTHRWPKLAKSFDPQTEEYVKLPKGELDYYKAFAEANGGRVTSVFWSLVIDRYEQANPPRKMPAPTKAEDQTGLKDMSSKSWTPIYFVIFNSQLVEKIQTLMERNKGVPPSDPAKGFDIMVRYDTKTKAPDKWSVAIPDEDEDDGLGAGKVALAPEETEYLTYDLAEIYQANLDAQNSRDALEELATTLPRFIFRDKNRKVVKTVVPGWLRDHIGDANLDDEAGDDFGGEPFDDGFGDEPEAPRGTRGAAAGRGASRSAGRAAPAGRGRRAEPEDDFAEEPEAPRGRRGRAAPAQEEDPFGDEPEAPRGRGGRAPAPTGRRRAEEPEEEEAPAPRTRGGRAPAAPAARSGRPPARTGRPGPRDDDAADFGDDGDFGEDLEGDVFDDAPAPAAPRGRAAPAGRGRAAEPEAPRTRGGRAPAAPAGRRRPRAEDEEESPF